MGDRKTAAGLVILAAAIAVAAVNQRAFPHGSYVVIFIVLLWSGWTLVTRGWKARQQDESHRTATLTRPNMGPLRPGESYDNPVRLATMPNVPIAEIWRQRLHENGIESFYKGATPFGAGSVGITNLNQGLPVALWVGERDLGRARELFPELRET
jgi:hypothetical protein